MTFLNIIGALSLIRYCLTPDPSLRAATKDILRHEWLANGPVLSLCLDSTTTTSSTTPTMLSHTEQSSQKEQEKVPLRTKYHDKSISPNNSLVDLELHTSAFFDTAKLRNHNLAKNIEQQRRNRASAIPDSTRYYSSNNENSNSSTPHSAYRRPLSLSLDGQYSNSPIDYHFALTTEKLSKLSPPPTSSAPTGQPYMRRSRRTVSPATTKATTTYGNNDRLTSPPASHRYSLATSHETKKSSSPINPSKYLVSYDFDPTLSELKRKPVFKYTPANVTPASDINVVPSLSNSTTPVAPSVFTTSAIKFAPPPMRRTSPIDEHDISANNTPLTTERLLNHTKSNPISNIDDSINTTATTNTSNNRYSLLTSFDPNHLRKSRLLDDNNNLISLRVHD